MVTVNTQNITQSSQAAATPSRVTFEPPLTPEQSARLQNTPTRAEVTQQPASNGQARPALVLPNGEQLPVRLEPPLPNGSQVNVTARSATDATAAQVLRPNGTPLPPAPQNNAAASQPQANQSNQAAPTQQLPNSPAPVVARNIPTFPTLPNGVPTQTTVITPPQVSQGNAFQTLTTLTPPANNNPAAPTQLLPRVEVQPHTPLPLGTRVTVTLNNTNTPTANLTNITAPTNNLRAPDNINLTAPAVSTPTPANTLTLPPLPTSSSAIAKILISLRISPLGTRSAATAPTQTQPQQAQTQAGTVFTARVGPQLPTNSPLIPTPPNLNAQQPANTQTLPTQTSAAQPQAPTTISQLSLPNGQSALIQSPTPLPQGTLLSVTQAANNPASLVATRIIPLPQSTPQTQLPQPLTFSSNTPPPPQFNATVTAQNTATQTTTLSINLGRSTQQITIPTPPTPPLTIGTQVSAARIENTSPPTLQIVNITPPAPLQPAAQTVASLNNQWPTFTQALNLLQVADNTLGQDALRSSIPNLSNNPLIQLLSFAEAAKTANTNKFLSDDLINTLRTLGIDLTPDLQNLQTLANRNEGPDSWRGFIFPYLENEQDNPQQGGFYYRQQEGEDGEDAQTRFLVNLHLKELGTIHLDGLYQPQSDNVSNSLNLRLHTQTSWPDDFKQQLSAFVTQTMENMSLSGNFTITTAPPTHNPTQDILTGLTSTKPQLA